MSMRNYAVDDYGLLMTKEMLRTVALMVCDGYTKEDYEDDEFAFNDELYARGIVEYIGSFTGESTYVNDDGTKNWIVSEYYNDDIIWYVPIRNVSTLFKAAYENMDEMITEFKESLDKYLPDDFNYRKHIRHISGTYYG